MKNCKNCDYYVNNYGYGQCYGQKDAPRVEDDDCCEDFKEYSGTKSNDTISRVALKDKCNEIMQFNPTTDRILDLIDNAPAIEGEILTKEAYSDLCLRASRARPQGKWIKKQVTPASCTYVCSECGIEEIILSNFCRYCGADMRGKEE